MKIGVPGEFHEERWQRTAEDSERCMLPRTREVGGTHRYKLSRGEGWLLAGLRHSSPAHRYLSAIPAWRRGSSDRSSARQPCPQVLQSHPRVAKGRKSVPLTGLRSGLGPGLARLPCPQVLQRHSGVAKGASDRSSARRPCPQVLQRHHVVAKGASGRSLARPPCPQVLRRHPGVAKGASGRSLARPPCPQVPQWHPSVAKDEY